MRLQLRRRYPAVLIGLGIAAVALLAPVQAGFAGNKPSISFVPPSPAEGATSAHWTQFAFTYNRGPQQTQSLTCVLSGPTPSLGACDPPVGSKKESTSGASYCPLANGSYTFTVTLTLTNSSTTSATRRFTVVRSTAPIGVDGCSYTETTGITGQNVTGKTQFSIVASTSGGVPSGTLSVQNDGCLTNGVFDPTCSGPDKTLYQVGYDNVNVECLSADASTGTVWFSGQVVAGDDQRLPAEQRQQEQNIIAAGNLMLIGRFQDTNSDGIADQRSLFLTMATTAYPNALLLSSDNGTITSPWFLNTTASDAAHACHLQDSAYVQADYKVTDGPNNRVQWLEPDDTTTTGSPFTGTASNLANPPAASLYSIANVTRTLLSPTLYLAFG